MPLFPTDACSGKRPSTTPAAKLQRRITVPADLLASARAEGHPLLLGKQGRVELSRSEVFPWACMKAIEKGPSP